MKIHETDLDRATRRVMLSVPRMVRRSALPVRAADGSFPVVVALPDETMADIDVRRDAAGGDVNLFVAYPDRIVLVTVHDGDAVDDIAEVHPDSTVEMVLAWLRETPAQAGAISLATTKAKPVVQDMEYASIAN